ncbi:fimbrial protein [Citrobacter arsenatis]|uniref:fimbrial protein n=1 Tax=Citrobacter arsenatis TaxID=2546350 RepID=UPI00300E4CAA
MQKHYNFLNERNNYMKNSLLSFAATTLLLISTAHAGMRTDDQSAVLTISGNVTSNESSCSVQLSRTAIDLTGNLEAMPAQGMPATPASSVLLSVTGGTQCDDLVSEGKIDYKFIGIADNADGTVLANTASTNAAAGVGIGLYDANGRVVQVNGTRLTATQSTALGLSLVKLNGQVPTQGTVAGSLTIQIERL